MSGWFTGSMVWDSATGDVEEKDPDLDTVRARVQALDGREHTLVEFHAEDVHFVVGGDAASGLLVSVAYGDKMFSLLGHAPDDGAVVQVVAGGQPADYPAGEVVDLAAAMAAVETFVETGRLDERAGWRRE